MLARTDTPRHVVVVGAGMGGLTAALLLADAGFKVTVIEKEAAPGGKLREVVVGGRPVDSGPTVLTLRSVLDRILATVGERLDDHLTLTCSELVARHHWADGSSLDLFRDVDRSVEAIGAFAGRQEADRYRAFAAATADVYKTLEGPFVEAETATPFGLAGAAGLRGVSALWRIRPFTPLWSVIGAHFRDPRLRQLFGRYATYCGSSPFEAPGPLMLVAHVEQSGVWLVREGMHAIARMLEKLARARGTDFLYGTAAARIETQSNRAVGVITMDGTHHACEAVVFNGDPSALADGCVGPEVVEAAKRVAPRERSLSAFTLSMTANAGTFPLAHHNVFFSADYEAEFQAIRRHGAVPNDPTVYLCAEDRGASGAQDGASAERLFTIVNAPANGDARAADRREVETWTAATLGKLSASGLTLRPDAMEATTPVDFARLFPATGGALYGRASHGWAASFQRPTARTSIARLYLAGGAVHPGPGLPMAALSGRNAARAAILDLGSTRPSILAATHGGTSTR